MTGWTQNPLKTSCEKCPKNDTFFGSEMFSKCMHMTMEPHQKMLFWLRAVRAVSDSAEVETQRCPGTILHPGKINYNISYIAFIWTAVYIPSIQYCSFFYYWRQYNCSLGYTIPVPLPFAQFCLRVLWGILQTSNLIFVKIFILINVKRVLFLVKDTQVNILT